MNNIPMMDKVIKTIIIGNVFFIYSECVKLLFT